MDSKRGRNYGRGSANDTPEPPLSTLPHWIISRRLGGGLGLRRLGLRDETHCHLSFSAPLLSRHHAAPLAMSRQAEAERERRRKAEEEAARAVTSLTLLLSLLPRSPFLI